MIKISFGCTRDFRVKMWGTSLSEDKLAGGRGSVIEAIANRQSSVRFFYSKEIGAEQFGPFSTASTHNGLGQSQILHCTSPDMVAVLRYAAKLLAGGDLIQPNQLKRREFITLLGGAAAWPLAARAQQPAMPVLGILHPTTAEATRAIWRRSGCLKDGGYVEGQNLAIEFATPKGATIVFRRWRPISSGAR